MSKKIQSRKFWIVVWACLIITIWGSSSLIYDVVPAWMSGAMALLIAIPAGYVAIGTAKKKSEDK